MPVYPLQAETIQQERSVHGLSVPQPLTVSDDNLLVVEFSYEQLLLEESVFAFHTPEYTLIPIQILIDSLDLPLSVDLDTLTIDGWFIKEGNTFSLDIRNRELYIAGVKQPWPKNFLYAEDGFDLYFDTQTIEEWFGFILHLNVSQLSLIMHSDTPLPLIEQKIREEKRKKLKNNISDNTPQHYIKNTYDWIGAPIIDIEHSFNLERRVRQSLHDDTETETPDIDTTNTSQVNNKNDKYQTTNTQSSSIQGSMDALKHSLNFSYTRQEEEEFRLTLKKSASKPKGYLWPGVDQYAIGDLTSHSDNIIFKPSNGLGVYFSKGSTHIQEQNSTLLLVGDAPPGWEVELYRNGALIDFTNVPSNGKFEFKEIETYIGENIFDVRIYGPQGQFRELQKRINISSKMLHEGDWNYQTYALEKNKKVIEPKTNSDEPHSGVFILDTYYGINDAITSGFTYAQLTPESQNEAFNYLALSSYASFLGGVIQIKSAINDQSGSAHNLAFKNRWNSINYNVELNKFNHLITEHNNNDILQSDASLKLNGLIQDTLPVQVNYDLRLSHEQYRSDHEQWKFSKRLSTRIFQTTVAHSLDLTNSHLNEIPTTIDASLALTRRIFDWRTKVETSYTAYPTWKLSTFGTSASYRIKNTMSYMANLTYSNLQENVFTIDNTLSWMFKQLTISLSLGGDNQDNQFFSLGLNTSLGYDSSSKALTFDGAGSSNNASALIRTYIDDNNNGKYDDNEPGISDAIFKGRNHWKHRPTNEDGLTMLSGIPNLKIQTISLDTRSIDDPYLQARNKTQHIYTHAGKQSYIEFGLVPSLEVEGAVKYILEGTNTPLAGIPIILKSKQSDAIFDTLSEYDGVFIFEGIPPGQYTLEIAPKQKLKKKYILPPPISIDVNGSDGVIYTPDFQLLPTTTDSE